MNKKEEETLKATKKVIEDILMSPGADIDTVKGFLVLHAAFYHTKTDVDSLFYLVLELIYGSSIEKVKQVVKNMSEDNVNKRFEELTKYAKRSALKYRSLFQ